MFFFFLFPRRGKMFTGFFSLTRTGTQPQDKQAPFVGRSVYGTVSSPKGFFYKEHSKQL